MISSGHDSIVVVMSSKIFSCIQSAEISGRQRRTPELDPGQYDEPNVPPLAPAAISDRLAEVAVWTPT